MAGGARKPDSRPGGVFGNEQCLKTGQTADWHWALGAGKAIGLAQPTIGLVGWARSGGDIANPCGVPARISQAPGHLATAEFRGAPTNANRPPSWR